MARLDGASRAHVQAPQPPKTTPRFQAAKGELKALFSAFGAVKRVRIPKKMGGVHRGFAFVDFSTAQVRRGCGCGCGCGCGRGCERRCGCGACPRRPPPPPPMHPSCGQDQSPPIPTHNPPPPTHTHTHTHIPPSRVGGSGGHGGPHQCAPVRAAPRAGVRQGRRGGPGPRRVEEEVGLGPPALPCLEDRRPRRHFEHPGSPISRLLFFSFFWFSEPRWTRERSSGRSVGASSATARARRRWARRAWATTIFSR